MDKGQQQHHPTINNNNNKPSSGIKLERCRQCKEVYTSQHELLKSALFSDIDIYAPNNNNNNKGLFRAHKYILATGSIVLKEYLTMYPHTSSLHLKSFIKHDPFNVAIQVLEFLYSRHIVVNATNILAIIRVAKQLRIDDLLQLSHAVLFRVCAQDPCSMLPMCVQFNYVHDQKLLTYLVDVLTPKIESNEIVSVQALAHFNILDFETYVLKHQGLSMHAKFYCLQVYVGLNLTPPSSQWISSSYRTCLIHHHQRAIVTDPTDDLCTCTRLNTPVSQDQCIRLWSLINFNTLSPDLLATAFRIPNIPQHLVFDAVMAKLVNGQQPLSNSDGSSSTVSEKQIMSETISRLVDTSQQNPSSSAKVSPVNSIHGPRPLGNAPVVTPPFARAAYSQNASCVDLHHHHQYKQVPMATGGGSILPSQSVPSLNTPSPANSEGHLNNNTSSPTTTQNTSETNTHQKAIEPATASLQLQTILRTQMDPSLSNIVAEYASPSLAMNLNQPPQYTPTTTTNVSPHNDLFVNYSNTTTTNSLQPCEPVYNHIWTVPDNNTAQPSMYVQHEYVIPSTSSPQQHVKVLGPVHELQPSAPHLSSTIPQRQSGAPSSDASTNNGPFSELQTFHAPNHGPSPLHVSDDLGDNGSSDHLSPGPKQVPAKRAPYNNKSHMNVNEHADTFDTNGVVLAHKKKKSVMARLSSLVR